MSKTKRMIYIREDNLDFYDALENKSEFVNDALVAARDGVVHNIKDKQVVGNTQTENSKDQLEKMRERDLQRLKEYREKNGIAPPAGV